MGKITFCIIVFLNNLFVLYDLHCYETTIKGFLSQRLCLLDRNMTILPFFCQTFLVQVHKHPPSSQKINKQGLPPGAFVLYKSPFIWAGPNVTKVFLSSFHLARVSCINQGLILTSVQTMHKIKQNRGIDNTTEYSSTLTISSHGNGIKSLEQCYMYSYG